MDAEQKEENEYLIGLSPRLFGERLLKSTRTPEGYFEGLPDRVLAKVNDRDNSAKRPREFWSELGRYNTTLNWLAAAAVALLLALAPFVRTALSPPASAPSSDPIAEAATLLRQDDGDEINSFADKLDEALLVRATHPEVYANPTASLDVSSEALITYLMKNGVSTEMIYESNPDIFTTQTLNP